MTDINEEMRTLKEKIKVDIEARKEKLVDLRTYLDYVSKIKDKKEIGEVCYYIGKYYFRKLNYEKGLFYLDKALNYAKEVSDKATLCGCYNHLSGYYILKMNEIVAIDCLYKQMEYLPYLKEEEQYPQLFVINANIASLFEFVGSNNMALKYYQEALKYLKKFKQSNKYYEIILYINMTSLYIKTKKYTKAVKYATRMVHYVKKDKSYIMGFQCRAILLYARLKKESYLVLKEEIDTLYQQMMAKEELNWYDIQGLYYICNIFEERGEQKRYRQVIERIIPYAENMLGAESKKEFMLLLAKMFKESGEEEKFRDVCVELYQNQLLLDKENKEAKAKSLEEYVAVKNKEFNQIELARQHEELKKKSNYDELTNIPNRYFLNEYCQKIFPEAIKNQTPISVEVIDVDFFKQLNDNYGHLEGDKCLIAIAKEISKIVTEGDLCARYGGDEFIIVRQNKTRELLEKDAYLLRQRIMELGIIHEYSAAAKVATISQGIVNLIPKEGQGIKDFIKIADEALYEAKKISKNTVVIK